MPSLFKRGDRYYVAFHDATRTPTRKQVSLRVGGQRAARAKAARLIARYEEGVYDPWTPPQKKTIPNLGDAVSQFMATRANLSPQSIQKYRSVLGQLVRHQGGSSQLGAFTTNEIQSFIDSGNRRPITKKTYSTTLSPFFNWCSEQKWVDQNPVSGVRLPKVQQGLPKVLLDEDVRVLLETIRRYDAESTRFASGTVLWMNLAVQITLSLGLRASELCQLQWEDIDFTESTVRVGGREGFMTKNAKARLLPMTDRLSARLEAHARQGGPVVRSSTGNRLTARYLSVRFKYFARLAGLPERISFHSLRHTCCTNLIANGASIESVRRFLGHSSIVVTQRYIHLSDDLFSASILKAKERRERNSGNG